MAHRFFHAIEGIRSLLEDHSENVKVKTLLQACSRCTEQEIEQRDTIMDVLGLLRARKVFLCHEGWRDHLCCYFPGANDRHLERTR